MIEKQILRLYFALLLTGFGFTSRADDTTQVGMQIQRDTLPDVPKNLPEKKAPFYSEKDKPLSGFKIRGIKGLAWTPEQYLSEIPILAKYKMNFLMNCYLSMYSQPPLPGTAWNGETMKNEWWLPIPTEKKAAYEQVFKKSKEYGIDFCFSIHPQLFSSRPANLSSEKDFELLWQHYAWAQSKGVRWFSVTIDDIDFFAGKDFKISGEEHAYFVNKLLQRLRKKDKGVQMILCPTYYSGVGHAVPKEKTYLEALAKLLDKDVYVFWTGPVASGAAMEYKSVVKHRMFLWDNYPVNDNSAHAIHLAPITGRDPALAKVVDGYISNPLGMQSEINRIPLYTIADFCYDPYGYDRKRSIGQAILEQCDNPRQQELLLEVVKLYSSDEKGVLFNPILDNFDRIAAQPFSRPSADMYLNYLKGVQVRVKELFPNNYDDVKQTLASTIALVDEKYQQAYSKL